MARTIVECLIPAVPCAECEERDCCRDERRVEMLRARVAELEARANILDQMRKESHVWHEQRVDRLAKRIHELVADHARLRAAESRASSAVEAHAALLSRIAADGTLDAMECASAAEQRVERLEVELVGVCGAAESLLSPDSSAVDIERLRVRVREARAALAASDCRCGHADSQHYAEAEARGRPCRAWRHVP